MLLPPVVQVFVLNHLSAYSAFLTVFPLRIFRFHALIDHAIRFLPFRIHMSIDIGSKSVKIIFTYHFYRLFDDEPRTPPPAG